MWGPKCPSVPALRPAGWSPFRCARGPLLVYHGQRCGIGGYLSFYNDRRVHQALGYRTPAEVYAEREVAAPAGD